MSEEPHGTDSVYWVIAFNAMPIFGVLFFGWQVFELVFLYWLENVVIGIFTFLKFVVRRYEHGVELILPFFFAPFFLVHYGGFTAGHGIFVFALFGDDLASSSGMSAPRFAWHLFFEQGLVYALVGFVLLHALEWRRDIAERGIGADSVISLMTAPYRRIVVLHLTIIGSGFALQALGEPMLALLLLVGLKTGFDVYHQRKGSNIEKVTGKKIQKIKDSMIVKKFEVNGKEYEFDTFAEMAESKHFNTAMTMLRLFVSKDEVKAAEDFLAEKIAEEMEQTDTARAT